VLKFPQLIKIELMKLTKSEKAIPELVKALNNLVKAFNDKEDNSVRRIAAEALGKIGQHPPHRPQQRPRSD
jgi:HEAT repeat protein